MRYFSKAMLVASAALCLNLSVYSQNITLKAGNVTVKEAIELLRKNTGYSFVFSSSDLNTKQRVFVSADNATIQEVVNQILKGQNGLDYEIQGKKIVVRKAATLSPSTSQNKRSVSGKVVDTNNEPIIGATIMEKGTTNGTITDFDGNFTLNVADGAQLEISYVGFRSQELKAVYGKDLAVTLKEDTEMLDEVVVVGFGTQKKVNLTGSVGTASAKDFEARPVANAVQALQGVVPGLNISSAGSGGELDASKSINIRGTGTIGSSSGAPLVLIDGMEGDLSTINPQDIENISVLKDAAASSIYGSRAPFGVILVTTKSGKSGKVQLNYNMNVRLSTPVKLPKMANSFEFVTFFDDGNFNAYGNHLFPDAFRQQVKDYMLGNTDELVWGEGSGGKWNYDYTCGNVDWLREYYRNWAPAHEHNISASGGNDKFTYYISANYIGQKGFMRYGTESHDKYNFTGKISAQLTDFIKIDYSSRYSRVDYDRPSYMSKGFYNDILRRARPIRPVYDPNGYLMSDVNYVAAMKDGGRHKDQNDGLSQQLKMTITPLKNWNIIGEFNMKTGNNWTHEDQFMIYSHYKDNPENTYPAVVSIKDNRVSEYAYRSTYLTPTLYSNYHFSFDKNSFSFVAGTQIEDMKYRKMKGERYSLVTNSVPVLDLTYDMDNYTLEGQYQRWSNVGFFGRVNYDYDGKYLLEANIRYDGSSRFRREDRWVTTPSFSLGWNMARENFWKNIEDYVQMFKLRLSYGELANQNTNSLYPTYQLIDFLPGEGNWLQNGVRPNIAKAPGLVSTTLTWERIKNLNMGFDFGAFGNRLTGSFDYFIRKTTDMVGPGIELPLTLGAKVPDTNNCNLSTYGWELQLSWRDQIGDFSYGVKMNLSDAKSKIDSYPNPTRMINNKTIYDDTDLVSDYETYIDGEILGNIYGFETIGIAKTQEEMDAHIASLPNGGQTALGNKWEAGDIMYADINNDGKVDSGSKTLGDMGDMKKIGNKTPRYLIGLNLDAAWKGFDISMLWQGVLKRDFAPSENSMVFWGVCSNQWFSTSLKEHIDYFRPENTSSELGPNVDSYYPRPVLGTTKNHKVQTGYLQNAAYLRLKNLQIGYTLPKHIISKIGLQNLKFYLSGENLLTITSLTDVMDPESVGIGYQGGTVYPLAKTFSFGMSVNF